MLFLFLTLFTCYICLKICFSSFDFVLLCLSMFWLESWMIWCIDEHVLMCWVLLLFVVKSNACLGIVFVLFIFYIFIVSLGPLGCLVIYQKHVRFCLIVVLLLALKLCFWARMCVHAQFMCTHTRSKRNHTIGMRTRTLCMHTHTRAQKCIFRFLLFICFA